MSTGWHGSSFAGSHVPHDGPMLVSLRCKPNSQTRLLCHACSLAIPRSKAWVEEYLTESIALSIEEQVG